MATKCPVCDADLFIDGIRTACWCELKKGLSDLEDACSEMTRRTEAIGERIEALLKDPLFKKEEGQ